MIRKKKSDPDKINDVNEFDAELDNALDMDKKESKKSSSFPWKRKKKVDTQEVEEKTDDISEEDSSSKDPLNLQEENVTYVDEHKKKISKKKIAIIAAIVVAAGAGIIALLVKNINGGDDTKVYVESVSYIAGLSSDSGSVNRYTGIVEVQDSWKITLDDGLSVETCYVKVGDEVKKGDKLFSYNTEEIQLNKEKKELELETLQNENTQLTKDIASYNSDLSSASASDKIELQTQILTAQTTIKKNEYSIKAAKEEIEKLEESIKDATVTSKMAGVVKSINSALGNASSDDDSGSYSEDGSDSSVYMNILALGDYRVKGTINETNASSMAEGQAVIIRSRIDDTTWYGSVSKLNTDSTADEESQSTDSLYGYSDEESSAETASTYNFYVTLEDDEGLMMGQHVFIEPDEGQDMEREGGIWISSAYILVDGDKYYVWIDNGHDRLEKKEVTIGEYDEELDEYEITDGITAEDYIACDDIDLKEGAKTTKVDPYSEDSIDDEDFDDSDSDDEFDDGGIGDDFLIEDDYDDSSSDYDDSYYSDDELESGEEYFDDDFSGDESDYISSDDDSDLAE